MFKKLIENYHAEVALLQGVLSFRTWDEVTGDFMGWRAVDGEVLAVIEAMPTASDAEVVRALSDDSTHNLSDETALAIVQAVRLK
ncbi:hypothetical protein PQR05_29445 [Paraburkholderia sediminicola]|uniref:hypothetical protein n=1 Tax=Paraburkholderia sediminicola TaxID=458836 RepID=UPI0038B866C4